MQHIKRNKKIQKGNDYKKKLKPLKKHMTQIYPYQMKRKMSYRQYVKESFHIWARLSWCGRKRKTYKVFLCITLITKQEDILEEVKNFYSDLYKHRETRDININDILNNDFLILTESAKNNQKEK